MLVRLRGYCVARCTAVVDSEFRRWLEKDVLYERVPTSLALRLEQQSLKSADAEEFDE